MQCLRNAALGLSLMWALPVLAADDVVLAPPSAAATFRNVGLIYAGGEGLSAEQYTPLVKTMQAEAVKNQIALWVGVPQFPANTPPIGFANNVNRVYGELTTAGMPSGTPMVAAAHSLGGVFLQMYQNQQMTPVHGRPWTAPKRVHEKRFAAAAGQVSFQAVVFMGTFVTKPNTQNWTTPTMHIAGEIDGLARITRMAQAVSNQFEPRGGLSSDLAVRDWPVGVIDGAGHMSFASGTPPALVKSRDLKAEVSLEVAHSQVAGMSMAFIVAQLGDNKSAAIGKLRAWVSQSYDKYWTPLLTAFEEEGLYATKPACNCNNPQKEPFDLDKFFGGWINYYPCLPGTTTPGCRSGSPWAGKMQVKLANLAQYGVEVQATSAFHPVSQTRPETNLPYVFGSCTSPTSSCRLNVTVVTENHYHKDALDTGFYPQAAIEIRAKQISRQRMLLSAGFPDVKFNDTDRMSLNLCAELNKEALEWAMQHATSRTQSRYASSGEQIRFGNDINGEGGPLWIDQKLKQERITADDGTVYNQISSIAGSIQEPFPVKSIEGTHYCKLYSPAAALEWMMIDGLRLHNSL